MFHHCTRTFRELQKPELQQVPRRGIVSRELHKVDGLYRQHDSNSARLRSQKRFQHEDLRDEGVILAPHSCVRSSQTGQFRCAPGCQLRVWERSIQRRCSCKSPSPERRWRRSSNGLCAAATVRRDPRAPRPLSCTISAGMSRGRAMPMRVPDSHRGRR